MVSRLTTPELIFMGYNRGLNPVWRSDPLSKRTLAAKGGAGGPHMKIKRIRSQ